MHRTKTFFCSLALTLALGSLAYSQSFSAAVRGNVTDSTGAAVPGARIAIIESDRNVAHRVVSDEAGRYIVTALPPGNYRINVEAPGFKQINRTQFALVVQQQATVDFVMEVGDISTSVTVDNRPHC